MKILNVRASKIKGIDKLTATVEFDPVRNIVFGGNGSGKTTILQALSLLGHASVLPMVKLDQGGIHESHSSMLTQLTASDERSEAGIATTFRRLVPVDVAGPLAKLVHEDSADQFSQLTVEDQSNDAGLEALLDILNRLPDTGAKSLASGSLFNALSSVAVGIVELTVSFDGDRAERVLFLFELLPGEQGRVNITDRLSMRQSDVRFSSAAACVFSSDFSDFQSFLFRSFLLRGHQLADDDPASIWRPAPNHKEDPSLHEIKQHEGMCAYVNTDLYDFGRGFDLTESPKRSGRNAYEQLVTRLNLPFEKVDGLYYPQFQGMNAQSDSLPEILNEVFPEWRDRQLSSFHMDEDREEIGFKVAKPGGGTRDITHFSLGENEVIYIFSLLTGLPLRRGILILDEPASGLASETNRRFLACLYRVAKERDIQLFIVSHRIDPISDEADGEIFDVSQSQGCHTIEEIGSSFVHFQRYRAQFTKRLGFLKAEVDRKFELLADGHMAEFVNHRETVRNKHDVQDHWKRFLGFVGLFVTLLFGVIGTSIALKYPVLGELKALGEWELLDWVVPLASIATIASAYFAFVATTDYFTSKRREIGELKSKVQAMLEENTFAGQVNPVLSSCLSEALRPRWMTAIGIINLHKAFKGADLGKALAFLAIHILVAAVIVYLFTGASLWTSGAVAVVEPFVNFWVFLVLDALWPSNHRNSNETDLDMGDDR